MTKLSFSTAWDETRAILRRDGRLIWPLGLMTLVLPWLLISTVVGPTAMTGMAQNTADAVPVTMLLAISLMMWARFGGLIAIAQLSLRSGERVGDALQSGLRRAPAVLGALILTALPLLLLMGPALLSGGQPQQLSPIAALGFLVGVVVAVVIFARLQFAVSAAASEGGNPIRLLARCWQLSRGNTLRLLGFALLFAIVLMIVSLTLTNVLGLVVVLLLGKPEPLSVAGLLVSALGAIGEMLVLVPYSVMLARLYRQVSHGAASVPHAP